MKVRRMGRSFSLGRGSFRVGMLCGVMWLVWYGVVWCAWVLCGEGEGGLEAVGGPWLMLLGNEDRRHLCIYIICSFIDPSIPRES
jgi:hypothetical protein